MAYVTNIEIEKTDSVVIHYSDNKSYRLTGVFATALLDPLHAVLVKMKNVHDGLGLREATKTNEVIR